MPIIYRFKAKSNPLIYVFHFYVNIIFVSSYDGRHLASYKMVPKNDNLLTKPSQPLIEYRICFA